MQPVSAIKSLFPGVLVSILIAVSAQFVSDHYGAPAMLLALLFGIALNFLSEEGRCEKGISFTARSVLRLGVALLGLRISVEMIAELGWAIAILVVGGTLLTIAFGLLIARFFGHGPRFAFLSSGAVAICGASAAMAIAAVLPKDERSEERLVFTVVGVTLLSTIAMILFPVLSEMAGFSTVEAGVFIGATIHDVAQVVGAGFSISNEAGEIATIVKLMRVAMLAPVILVAALVVRRLADVEHAAERPPLLPGFVIAFVALIFLNSTGVLPVFITELATDLAGWALLTAIAAVGLKTSLKETIKVGLPAIALLVVETLFLAGLIICALLWVQF